MKISCLILLLIFCASCNVQNTTHANTYQSMEIKMNVKPELPYNHWMKRYPALELQHRLDSRLLNITNPNADGC